LNKINTKLLLKFSISTLTSEKKEKKENENKYFEAIIFLIKKEEEVFCLKI